MRQDLIHLVLQSEFILPMNRGPLCQCAADQSIFPLKTVKFLPVWSLLRSGLPSTQCHVQTLGNLLKEDLRSRHHPPPLLLRDLPPHLLLQLSGRRSVSQMQLAQKQLLKGWMIRKLRRRTQLPPCTMLLIKKWTRCNGRDVCLDTSIAHLVIS